MALQWLRRCVRPWVPEMSKIRWRGTARSVVLAWVIIATDVLVLATVVLTNAYAGQRERLGVGGWMALSAGLAFGLVISVLSSRIAVEVDADEFRVRFGWGWPVRRIPWAMVEKVEQIDIRPWQWGGWGYKINPARRSSAVVLRAGEGFKVTMANGRILVVTVDGAKRGLDAIREILGDSSRA